MTNSDSERETPAVYSPEHAAQIRERLLTPAARLSCPGCEDELTIGPAFAQGSERVREVRCVSCHRAVIVRELPE